MTVPINRPRAYSQTFARQTLYLARNGYGKRVRRVLLPARAQIIRRAH